MATMTCDGQRWTQDEIDAIERAKEQQRRREQEANQQRDANSQNRQNENRQ
ncbi:MAG: hypothetical protein ABSA78_04670 [Candidatus Sulfotelmatobacter sp.]|jgi:hypothetical protein